MEQPTTKVLLMRHAETAQPDVFHGAESDIDLGPRGYRQAAAVAPVVARYRPDVLYSSGMLRARMTAKAIGEACGLTVRVEPMLHERKVGKLQGTPVFGETGIWPETLERWRNGETGYAPEGMESFDEISDRLLPVWERITRENAGKTIAIVCHGIVCRVLMLQLVEGYNVADWPRLGRIANASISELYQAGGQAGAQVGSGRHWKAVRIGEVPDEVRNVHDPEEATPQ
jgi:2,3-bisphosphoglycerate-dependent phosphoglycerate mutase